MKDLLNKAALEIGKVIVGKNDVVELMLCAVLCGGHVLLDDIPGVGKTTLALSVGKVLGLSYSRLSCTPDVMPSDIIGFTVYNKQSGNFEYVKGAAVGANILLADEINRTSSKTQSALLEAMEEGQVTVDGVTHALNTPFIVIATQNKVGAIGTQLLPQAQLDRFLIKTKIGYPDYQSQMKLLRDRQEVNPLDGVQTLFTAREVIKMQSEVAKVTVKDAILDYVTRLSEYTRSCNQLELGISPRGALQLVRAAKARAYMQGRNYALPEDVRKLFLPVSEHRVMLSGLAKAERRTASEVLVDALNAVTAPDED